MSKTDNIDHYEILYENEKGVRYGVFRSTDLDALGQAYARMLQFENMFRTFPNASCHLILTRDYNYDPDCGSFSIGSVIGGAAEHKWDILVDDIIHDLGTRRLERPSSSNLISNGDTASA